MQLDKPFSPPLPLKPSGPANTHATATTAATAYLQIIVVVVAPSDFIDLFNKPKPKHGRWSSCCPLDDIHLS